MSVILQPFQALKFFRNLSDQQRFKPDCKGNIYDGNVIIPYGSFIPFAIVSDSNEIGDIKLYALCESEPEYDELTCEGDSLLSENFHSFDIDETYGQYPTGWQYNCYYETIGVGENGRYRIESIGVLPNTIANYVIKENQYLDGYNKWYRFLVYVDEISEDNYARIGFRDPINNLTKYKYLKLGLNDVLIQRPSGYTDVFFGIYNLDAIIRTLHLKLDFICVQNMIELFSTTLGNCMPEENLGYIPEEWMFTTMVPVDVSGWGLSGQCIDGKYSLSATNIPIENPIVIVKYIYPVFQTVKHFRMKVVVSEVSDNDDAYYAFMDSEGSVGSYRSLSVGTNEFDETLVNNEIYLCFGLSNWIGEHTLPHDFHLLIDSINISEL
jgi:hypothetical protein